MSRLGIVVADWAHVIAQQARAVLDRTPPDTYASGHLTPVVLVPGIWEPWRYLHPLARRLHALGHPVHPLPGLGWNGRPIEDSVDRARAGLDALGVDRPVLVAHSKGGLIGKALLLDAFGRDPDRAPRGLVAVCTPFGGSKLSWRVFTRTPLGLFAPQGATVLALAAERAADAHIVSIGSAWDEMIPNGSFLPGAHNITLRRPGHFRPVAAEGTARLVHEQVEALASR
ncbi:MAG TPA: alpha/beta hydrolase [Propionibacterium sp.]|nr:alpha/beta hydrolase [Propionibacterium sp.]